MADPTWDDFDIEDEEVTKDEAKDIESGGVKFPIGLYLCRCFSSNPKQIDFTAYSTLGVKLGFKVENVLEIEKRKPTADEVKYFIDKKMFDDVAFANEKEKAGMAKRRKMVALKLGLITPGESLNKTMWQKYVIGKAIILRVVDASYINTKTDPPTQVEKTGIDFWNGYESTDQAEAVTEKADEWDGII